MKYMLLVYLDEKVLSDEERQDCYVKSAKLARDIHSSGHYLDASPLHPVSTATSIRVREGKRFVTDGPFAETHEQLGGYYVLDCKDLDEAIEWAAKMPGAKYGMVEVRPVMTFTQE